MARRSVPHWKDGSVVEVMLNSNGQLFVEQLGQGIRPAGLMEAGAAEIIIGSVALGLAKKTRMNRTARRDPFHSLGIQLQGE